MGAPTQTQANKSSLAHVAQQTIELVEMYDLMGIKIGAGTGTPNGELTAPIGSLFIELGGPNLYVNTDGATSWEQQTGIYHFEVAAADAVAAATAGIHAFVTDAGDGTDTTITTNITNPAVPRNITATVDDETGDGDDIKGVSVIITGTNFLDEVITETLPVFVADTEDTKEGDKAFKTVTSILSPAHDAPYDVKVSIGWGDKLGLHKMRAHIADIQAFRDNVISAPTITASATAIESNTIKLADALNGTKVDAYLVM